MKLRRQVQSILGLVDLDRPYSTEELKIIEKKITQLDDVHTDIIQIFYEACRPREKLQNVFINMGKK